MKKTFTTTLMALLLCVSMVFGLASCGTSQEDIDNSVNTAIAPISEQITAINTSIDDLKAVDTALDGYIDALETKVTEIETNGNATAEEITAIKATIETLKSKDTEFEGKITTLENYVNTELSETENWAEATFATLAQYAEIQTEISNIKTLLTTLVDTTALSTAISTSESGMKEWVNKTLADGYYTIAEIDTKLSDLETKLNGADDMLEATIEEQKTALATAKNELTNAYITAINEAIETNNGEINQKIATDITTAKAELQTEIDNIKAEITEIKADITALNGAISELQNEIDELETVITHLKECLKGNHVIDETATTYVYVWSETEPTLNKEKTCLHCGTLKENVLPSAMQVGDKVTYIAKDGNPYYATVYEVTETNVVVATDLVGKVTVQGSEFTAQYLDPVGARLPLWTEKVWSNLIYPWVISNECSSLYINSKSGSIWYHHSSGGGANAADKTYEWGYFYIWDIALETAE